MGGWLVDFQPDDVEITPDARVQLTVNLLFGGGGLFDVVFFGGDVSDLREEKDTRFCCVTQITLQVKFVYYPK